MNALHINNRDHNFIESYISEHSDLGAYIQDESLKNFIERSLMHCRNPREWALLLIYKLYLEETLPWSIINSRNFITTTASLCINLKKANYENLRKALARQYNHIINK